MKPLSIARIRAHKRFDLLWQFGSMSRTDAYLWLSKTLDIPRHKCHIKKFDIAECEEVIRVVEEYINQRGEN